MTERVLVAGGTGRLGTLLVRRLTALGLEVRVLTRDPRRAAHLVGPHVRVITGDVQDADLTASAVAGVDVVVSAVHGFAGTGGGSPATIDRDGNIHLIEAAGAAGTDLILMSGVGAAPDSPMELFRMKYAAEIALSASGVPATIVRASAFLELWIELLVKTAGRSDRPVVFGRGQNPINFVSVHDVAALVECVVTDSSTRSHTFSIGGPDDLTLNDLAHMVIAHRGGSGDPRHVPRGVLRAMAVSIGLIRPAVGRQARAALAMDVEDMTFTAELEDHPVRVRFRGLPVTSAADVLRRPMTGALL